MKIKFWPTKKRVAEDTHADVHQRSRPNISSVYKTEMEVPARTAAQARRQSGERGPQMMQRIYMDIHGVHPPWSPPILSAGSESPRETLFSMKRLMSWWIDGSAGVGNQMKRLRD
jgi:hypothetical protein